MYRKVLVLLALLLLIVAALIPSVLAAPDGSRLRDISGDLLIGYASRNNFWNMSDSAQYEEAARTEFNFMTPENAMKWDAIHPSQNSYNFSQADQHVQFAQANGMAVHGHVLVWHSQNPSWLTNGNWSRSQLIDIMYDHIDTVAGHYAGDVLVWDVVNEAFNEDGTYRSSIWYDGIGQEYIDLAFERAHQADPNAKLIYNDYNIGWTGSKSNGVYNMAADMVSRGVPIDGVGFQMHLTDGGIDGNSLASNMQRFADLGLEVYITELDVRIPQNPSQQALQNQATIYQTVTDRCLAQPACKGLQVWGIPDKYSWVPDVFPGTGAPLLFDDNYNAKPAYYAVQAALETVNPQPSPTSPPTTSGFYVENGRLYDANGNEFIMRGVNHAHTWYTSQTGSFADIKNAGANTVRVVLSSGDRWTRNDASDVVNVISLCKENKLICMLEVHDTTGYGEEGAAATLDQAVDYWISIQSALTGEEAYILLNIGNEPYGNSGYQTWAADSSAAITRLRNAGFDHTIVIDAPNWGQDWSFTMRNNAASVFNSDPDGNTMFSIHMYGVFDTAAEIDAYLSTFADAGLPILVGEFGHNHSDGDPDEDAILSITQSMGIGYLGWSWSGNGGGVEYLDMVNNFNANDMTAWGDRLFNGVNGIVQTAQEASVYGGPPPPTVTPGGPTLTPTTPPTATPLPPTATPPPGGACAVDFTVSNQWSNSFQANVTITNNTGTAVSGWTLNFTHPSGQTATGGWNADISQFGNNVTVSNPASYWNGNIGANGGSVSFGLQGTFTGNVVIPTDFVLNGTACNQGGTPVTATPVPPTTTSIPPTATSVPPTATTDPPTATSIPPTATGVPPTATAVPPTATSVPPTATAVVPPTATSPAVGSCSVDYAVTNDWGSGFTANIAITNLSSTAINGWTLEFTFPGNQNISNAWGGTADQIGQNVIITDSGWNAYLAANGGSTSVGFQATYSNMNEIPTDFTLNGEACN